MVAWQAEREAAVILKHTNLVDPELMAAHDRLFPPIDYSFAKLPELRETARLFLEAQDHETTLPVECSQKLVSGPPNAPDVSIFTYRPTVARAPLPAFLHIHGGGHLVGSPLSSRRKHLEWASDLGCFIVSVDYRLAPETRFPGSIEDCYAVLAWLAKEAPLLGIDADCIAVGGDSAGGGLAAALALLARDRGEFRIVHQNLIYPMLDDRTGLTRDGAPHVGQLVWTREQNRLGWSALLAELHGTADVPPYAAPARARDLNGLPPAFIAVGDLDLFFDEDLEYARCLRQAGVAVELQVYPGAYHGFALAQDTRLGRAVLDASKDALRRAIARRFDLGNDIVGSTDGR
jgi:acetyl esterase/lipase